MKKFTQIFLTAIVLAAAFSITTNAQTNVSGGIYSNTTWTLINSPYIVVDTVVVFPGVTLTIEPGVVVKFEDHKYIEVRQASLIANGNSIDSITFTSNSLTPTPGIWGHNFYGGLWVNDTSGATSFNFCNVKYATAGIRGGNFLYIKNSNFINNVKGLSSVGDTPIDSCNFKFNNTGIDNIQHALLNFCNISNNTIGVKSPWGYGEIINCTIDSNQVGISEIMRCTILNCIINYNQTGMSENGLGGGIFKNCIVDYNSTLGISLEGNETDSVINCEIKFNGIGLLDISCPFDSSSMITQCVIESNTTGIQFTGCANIFCNKFCNNTSYDLENLSNHNYSLPNNYWCSTDSATIASHIYDGYDDISIGLVTFGPIDTIGCYLTGCNLQLSATVTNATCDTCHNGSAIAHITNGFAPYTYTWFTTPIQSTQMATGLASGTYTICVSDGHGCTACNPSVFVDSSNCTGFGIQANGVNATCVTCNDGSASVTVNAGTAPYNYTWYTVPIQTTPVASGLLPGTYGVCVTDLYGCSSCDSVTISTGNCSAHFNLNPDTVIHHYYAVNMASGVGTLSYSWNWGDGSPFDTIPYPNHTYASAGYYTICLTITDSVGCTNTYCNSFYLQIAPNPAIYVNVIPQSSTGITEEFNNESLLIFPNPVNDLLTLILPTKDSKAKIRIYNLLGQTEIISSSGTQRSDLDVSSLAKGIYILEISMVNKTLNKKIIKQ